MINDIKMGFKLMKYGLQFKTSLAGVILLLLGGILTEMGDEAISLSGFAFVMAVIMVYQLVQSVTCSTMVQSSAKKKKLQTSVSAICTGICMIIINTVLVIVKLISMHINNKPVSAVASWNIVDSIFILVVLVYMGAAMKMYWGATIGFGLIGGTYGIWMSSMAHGTPWLEIPVSLGGAIAISYLSVLAGCVIMYLISLATYKREFSKTTFDSQLKRAK